MANKILDAFERRTKNRDQFFSWLSDNEKEEGKKNVISIESIPGPSRIFEKKKESLIAIVNKIKIIIPSKRIRRTSSSS